MDVRVGSLRRLRAEELMLSNCGARENSWEFLGLQDKTSQHKRKSTLNILWKDWCWSSYTLATGWEEPTHWKRPWCWERLRAGVEGGDRGWDGWMASLTQWTWFWVSFRSWWQTGKPGVLQSMGSQRVGHDWVTELNWTVIYGVEYFFIGFSHLYPFFCEFSQLFLPLMNCSIINFIKYLIMWYKCEM